MVRFYNEDIKERFLNTLENETTRQSYAYTLSRAYYTELRENQDLYNFNREQIADVIKNNQPFRQNIVQSRVSVIRMYIDWAIKEEYREDNTNPLHYVDHDWYESLVDKNRKSMFNEEEIDDIIDSCVNYQDKALIRLIFEGASGNALSEISNLTEADINNFTNEINLIDNKGKRRKIEVSEKLIILLEKAANEKIYILNNGRKLGRKSSNIEKPLRERGYVFKNIQRNNGDETDQVSVHTFYNRVSMIKKDLEVEDLNPTSIRKSGQMKLAHDLYLENGKLDRHEVDVIGEQFGLRKITNNGSTYHNKTLLRDILSPENLMRYYGLDMEEDKQVK